MARKSNRAQPALERKLTHLEEYIKGIEVFWDGHIGYDRMLRDACRVDRAGFPSSVEHLRCVIHLIRNIPPPASAPDLPAFLADLNLWEAGSAESLYAKCAAEELAIYNRLAEIVKTANRRDIAVIKAKMNGLPSPWLVAPDLAPRLMGKLEALGQEITAIGDDLEPWADKLLESIRECVESLEDPSVTMQPIRDMLERAYQARDEMIKLLGAKGGDVGKSAPSKEMIVAYRLKFILGAKTQKEIAAKLSQEFGRKINQGTVSNWLRDVEAWIKAGNVLPDIPGLDKKPQSIDPRVIGMGARRDGRTPRQRAKRKEMDDE